MSPSRPSIPSSLRASTAPTPSPSPPSHYFKRRSTIYAVGFAVITIAGTLIGATLKSRNQAEEKLAVKQKEKEVQPDVTQQIAVLEETKLNLVQRRGVLERKILEVRERERKDGERRVERERMRAEGEEVRRELEMRRNRG
jgi:hypothetical protein